MTRRFAVVAAIGSVVALAGCWPAPGQGPDRRSHNPFETAIDVDTVADLTEVWRASIGNGAPTGPPVVSAGGVHVTDTYQLVTFDAATGARRWTTPDEPIIVPAVGSPVVDGDEVMFTWGAEVGFGGAWTSQTSWLDAATGEHRASAGGGTVRANRGSGRVVTWTGGGSLGPFGALLETTDDQDPTRRWSTLLLLGTRRPLAGFADGTTLGAEAVYHAGEAMHSFEDEVLPNGVRAFSLSTPPVCDTVENVGYAIRCPTWFTDTGTPVGGPVIGTDEDVLYVATEAGSLLALDAATGSIRWTAALGGTPSATPAFDGSTLFVPLGDGRLVAVPADGCGAPSCPVTWSGRTGGAGLQPAIAGGVVVVATDAGTVRAFPAAGCRTRVCRPLWRDDLGAAATGAPAISSGRIFVGTEDGGLVAFALAP